MTQDVEMKDDQTPPHSISSAVPSTLQRITLFFLSLGFVSPIFKFIIIISLINCDFVICRFEGDCFAY